MAEAGLSSFNPPGQPPATPWSEVIGNAFNRWMDQRQAEILEANKNTNPRSVAGDVISTAMNILPAGPRMAVPRGQGIRAYHGSPYDFDRFDLSRIGTGEGAQAYGHGLYFAENPKVAESYKMTGDARFNRVTTGSMTPHQEFAHDLASSGRSEMDIIGSLAQKYGGHLSFEDASRIAKEASAARGKMYEVNINAKPEQFLDWDRPLAGQAPEVKASMEQFKSLPGSDPLWSIQGGLRTGLPGEAVVRHLGKLTGGPENASAALRDAGIPGIRYLDQGSRNTGLGFEVLRTPEGFDLLKDAGGGGDKVIGSFATRAAADAAREAELAKLPQSTSNYVLFNDKIVDILRKWGVIGPTVGAGAAAATQDQSQ